MTSQKDRKIYGDYLCEILNNWGRHSEYCVYAQAIIFNKVGLGVLTLTKSKKYIEYIESESSEDIAVSLKRINKMLKKSMGRVEYLPGLKIFDGTKIHMVKPLTLRHWTRPLALTDAAEITTAILSKSTKKAKK